MLFITFNSNQKLYLFFDTGAALDAVVSFLCGSNTRVCVISVLCVISVFKFSFSCPITLKKDGTVLFNSKSDYASTHIIRQKSQAVLEVIEPDGMTTIQISNTGATSILHSMAEDEAEHSDPQESVKFRTL